MSLRTLFYSCDLVHSHLATEDLPQNTPNRVGKSKILGGNGGGSDPEVMLKL